MPTAAFGSPPPTRTETAELAPGRAVGEWRIERRVGEGGMAAVYAAVHPVLGKRVALKVLHESLSGDPDAVARFREEARIISRIAHVNLVDVYSYGSLDDGRPYFVMEWVAGQTLEVRLRKGPLPLDEVVDVVGQLTCALEAAHAHGVIHRDVKPENVLLVPLADRQVVKLVDFGIAKLARARGFTGDMVLGTPEYFSPEQARGGPLDARSDIYSLGVLLFHAIVGTRPFVGANPVDLAYQHLHAEPPRLRDHWPVAPVALDDLVARMLAKDPSRRPSLEEVRAVLRGRGSPARPRRRRRRALALPSVLAVGLALALAAGVVAWARPTPPALSPPAPLRIVDAPMCVPPPPAPPRHVKRHPGNELLDPFAVR